ncbi:ATP-binding protein [Streptomyces sp. NPDC059909]|uniref:ATP-binding protein n=1 Tax=Streptomyces sp. NPDC059909 TaxID=3346998 RepID=UPI003655C3EC
MRLWGLDDLRDSARLAVSELLTNVLLHTEPDDDGHRSAQITVTRTPDGVALCVHDGDPKLPREMTAAGDEESGRGLHLIKAVADRFGLSPSPAVARTSGSASSKPSLTGLRDGRGDERRFSSDVKSTVFHRCHDAGLAPLVPAPLSCA